MKKLAVSAAVVSIAVMALGGIAGAAPKAKAPKAPAPKANETIVITLDVALPNGPAPVTATGVFNATGTDTRTSRVAGRTDHGKDVLTFSGGTITVKDSGVRRVKLDKTACTKTLSEKGVWKIVKGTGDFAHTKGHGHYKATGTIQGVVVSGGCDFSTKTGTITITATGRVK